MVRCGCQILILFLTLSSLARAQWTSVDSGQEMNVVDVPNMCVVDGKLLLNLALWDEDENEFEIEFEGDQYDMLMYWDSVTFETAFVGLPITESSATPLCNEILDQEEAVYLVGSLDNLMFEDEEIVVGINKESGLAINLHAGNEISAEDAVVYHDTLFVFGQVWNIPGLDIDGNELPQVAAWTPDNEWHFVGGVWLGSPKAAVYDDKIVVVGYIEHVIQTDWTSSPSTAVAFYENGVWSAFPGNIQGSVSNVFVDPNNERLYCTGGNIWIDGEPTSGIIMYDGQQWHKMFTDDPTMYGHIVMHMGVYRGQVYAYTFVGNGSEADGYQEMMRYDGYQWHHEADFGGYTGVSDMLVYKDELYVCGAGIDSLNGAPLYPKNLVKLYVHPDSVQWGVPEVLPDSGTGISVLEQVNYELKVFPNPNESRFEVSVKNAFTGAILVTDLNGIQLYYEPVNNMRRHTVNLGDVPSGTYLLSLVDGGVILGTEKVVVR